MGGLDRDPEPPLAWGFGWPVGDEVCPPEIAGNVKLLDESGLDVVESEALPSLLTPLSAISLTKTA